jgi:hypothetical protein
MTKDGLLGCQGFLGLQLKLFHPSWEDPHLQRIYQDVILSHKNIHICGIYIHIYLFIYVFIYLLYTHMAISIGMMMIIIIIVIIINKWI